LFRLKSPAGMMLFALLVSFQFNGPCLAHEGTSQVLHWLENAGLMPEMGKAIQARVRNEPQARNWLIALDGQVASLVYRPWRHGQPSQQIRQQERNIAQMQAHQQLLLLAVDDHYHQYGLTDKVALATALYRVSTDYEFSGKILAGSQSSAAVLESGVVALVWTQEDRVAIIRQKPPPVSLVVPVYCKAMYASGHAQYELENFESALLIYHELYRLNCKIPDIYLDSARAFLKTTKPEDAKRLLDHTIHNMHELMSSDHFEQAGELFLTMGIDHAAAEAFDLALQKYRIEQGIE
jgi:tetratricopeptide (TPR) repeat protein